MTATTATNRAATSTSGQIGAAIAILGSVQYLVVEAIVAAAWHTPPYSYAVNYISDLGNPNVGFYDGSPIDSPLHGLMNGSFVVQGLMFIVAAFLLLRGAPIGTSLTLAVLAVLHGATTVLVGLFPEDSAALIGTVHVHPLSATVSIVTGNLAAIVVGIAGAGLGVPRNLRVISIVLGVVGLLGGALLLVDLAGQQVQVGISERISVYAIILWVTIVGVAVFVHARRMRSASGG